MHIGSQSFGKYKYLIFIMSDEVNIPQTSLGGLQMLCAGAGCDAGCDGYGLTQPSH